MDSAEDYLRVECEVSGDGRSVCLRLDGELDLGPRPSSRMPSRLRSTPAALVSW